MSEIETLIPVLAVLSLTLAGMWALPWNTREVAESTRAFVTLGRLSLVVVRRTMSVATSHLWGATGLTASPGSLR